MPSLEILAVLADEVSEVVDGMSSALGDLDAPSDSERLRDSLEFFSEQVERIEHAADMLELDGLAKICARVKDNVSMLDETEGSCEALGVFMRGPNLILDYLRSPKSQDAHTALVTYLADTRWPQPLTDGEQQVLTAELANVEETPLAGESAPHRLTEARPEDVSLAIAPDVNPAMVETFFAEGPLQAGAFSSLIDQVVRGDAQLETLNEARRLVHSIKGAANTIGVRGISIITHTLEDLLQYLAEHGMQPEGQVAKLLIDVADSLEMMFESLVEDTPPPAQAQTVLQRMLDTINAAHRGETIITGTTASGHKDPDTRQADAETEPLEVERGPGTDAPRPRIAPKVRVPATTIEEMLRLSGEMTTGRAHIEERLHHASTIAAEQRERHGTLQDRANEIERIVTVQGVAAGQKNSTDPDGVVHPLFDALELDQYSELHGAVHGFVETIADLQALESRMADTLAGIDTAIKQEAIINGELQEHVMRARMVEAQSIEPRLARAVRQLCDATGKQAVLLFDAGDVMLDDYVLHDLINPLTHLLRNAVDHGIEEPEMRESAGKTARGEISLSFSREGNHVVVRCADDGIGLDISRIRAAAVERGLLDADARLDDDEAARLILLPAFTTRTSVSELSGRGVGMDIVHTTLQKLKGTIDISSNAAAGTCFTLRLPMTMGTAHCLVVRSGGSTAAVPTDVLDRVIHKGALKIRRVGEHYTYREERESLPVYDLAHLLGGVAERSIGDEEDDRPVIVVNDTDGKKALVVDALLFGRDLVIKTLGRFLAGAPGVIGASVLGDGRVLQVLNVHELLRMEHDEYDKGLLHVAYDRAEAQRLSARPSVLVVDDSLTVRQTLLQLLTGEGYEVTTAKDGIEAMESIEKELPAVLLIDLEMPRMNGLELTGRLRGSERTRGVPVIMVTSRSSEKHREQARLAGVDLYITKPYREEELLSHLNSILSKAA